MKRLALAAFVLVAFSAPRDASAAPKSSAAGAVLVKHAAIAKAERGKELVMRAVITAAAGPYLPTLYYRPTGESRYYSLPMLPVPGALNIYAASVPGIFVSRDIDYYIESYDTQLRGPGTAGTQKAPIRVKVVEPELPPSQVVIRSDPPDAALKLDGVEKGRTPWIGLLPPGQHELLLSKEGYLEASSMLDVPEGRDLDTLRGLTLAAEQATFVVTSEPKGAAVRIDGQLLGATPLIAPSPDGEHTLTVEKQGYARATRRIAFSRERSLETNFTLTKLPPEPALAITTEPPGATVTVDGKNLGKTPFIGVVPSGDHLLELKLEGRRRAQAQIMMPEDRDLDLRFTLERADLARDPFVAISTEPPGAEVFIDGKSEGRSPYRVALAAGVHVVKLQQPGFKPYEKKFTMPDGNDLDVTVAMVTETQDGPATVRLAVTPPEARLLLDGAALPSTAPGIYAAEVKPGSHVALVTAPGYRQREERFVVQPGESLKVPLTLTQGSGALLTVQTTPPGAQLMLDGEPLGPAPVSRSVTPGAHRLSAALDGFKPREESFVVSAAGEVELGFTLALEPLRKSVTLASAAEQAAQAELPQVPVIDPEALAKAQRDALAARSGGSAADQQALAAAQKELEALAPLKQRALAVERDLRRPQLGPALVAGAGLVTGAVGALFGWLTMTDAADLKSTDLVVDRQTLVDRHDFHATLGVGLGAAGLGLLTVGAVWAVWPHKVEFNLNPDPGTEQPAAPSLSVAPTPGGAAVQVAGGF
jgi:hypothetical protein